MKIDILNLMNSLKENFNNHAELILSQDDDIIILRIRMYIDTNDTVYNYAISLSRKEINDSYINILNIKFYKAIQELKKEISNTILKDNN